MQSFRRILWDAPQLPRAAAACLATSIGIGLLWGANIGTLYPFVEVVFYGQSATDYLEAEVERTEAEIARLEDELTESVGDSTRVEGIRSRVDQSRRVLGWVERVQPWAEHHLPSTPMQTVLLVVALLFGTTLLRGVLVGLHEFLVSKASHRALHHLRRRIYDHALELDASVFDEGGSSRVAMRVTHDARIVGEGIRALLGTALREPLKLAVCIGGAAFISWRLTLLALVVAPLAAIAWRRMYLAARDNARGQMSAMSDLHAQLTESFSDIRLLKAFTMEDTERRRFDALSSTLLGRVLKLSKMHATLKPFSEVVLVGVVCVALAAGAYLVVNQETHLLGIPMTSRPLRPASMLLFYAFLIGMSDPARRLSGISITIQNASVAAERIERMLARRPQVQDLADTQALPPGEVSVAFEKLTFRYGEGEPALEQVDLVVVGGECVAIVGDNGSGKSTLLQLLLRFYDPEEGRVLVGGVDVRRLRMRELREAMALVDQSTTLFNSTVLDNIRRGRPSASAEEAHAAAVRAGADRLIREDLPNGYDTVVGVGGVALSGGQAQRIAVARALLREPRVLILDEATSSMDVGAELEFCRALEAIATGRTTLMATHRPALLEVAQRIVVMDAGRILDVGSHSELVARSQTYTCLLERWRHSPD